MLVNTNTLNQTINVPEQHIKLQNELNKYEGDYVSPKIHTDYSKQITQPIFSSSTHTHHISESIQPHFTSAISKMHKTLHNYEISPHKVDYSIKKSKEQIIKKEIKPTEEDIHLYLECDNKHCKHSEVLEKTIQELMESQNILKKKLEAKSIQSKVFVSDTSILNLQEQIDLMGNLVAEIERKNISVDKTKIRIEVDELRKKQEKEILLLRETYEKNINDLKNQLMKEKELKKEYEIKYNMTDPMIKTLERKMLTFDQSKKSLEDEQKM